MTTYFIVEHEPVVGKPLSFSHLLKFHTGDLTSAMIQLHEYKPIDWARERWLRYGLYQVDSAQFNPLSITGSLSFSGKPKPGSPVDALGARDGYYVVFFDDALHSSYVSLINKMRKLNPVTYPTKAVSAALAAKYGYHPPDRQRRIAPGQQQSNLRDQQHSAGKRKK